ncbi:MAG: deoxyribonuclease IV [Pseudomonadota bacterium]
MKRGPYLGAHMSIAGGFDKAVERGKTVEIEALQIFTKSSNQWAAKRMTAEEPDRFRTAKEEAGLKFVFAHDSYLINMASPDPALWEKSVRAFGEEMDRAEALGLDFLIFHPGAHMGEGIEKGAKRLSDALNRLTGERKDQKVLLLLENCAGQGTTVGRKFEELSMIRDAVEEKKRVGFCFDTCHAFAAGYDLRTKETYEATMKEFDRVAGLKHLWAFHVNDSKKGLDCRVDRHEHIGKGELGLEPFRFLLNDSRFKDHPMVIETPKSDDLHEDRENLKKLRSLLQRS